MRTALTLALCSTLLILSLGLRPPTSVESTLIRQARVNFETALLTNDTITVKSALVGLLDAINKGLKANSCYYVIDQLVNGAVWDDALKVPGHWLRAANKDCYPVAEVIRNLLEAGIKYLDLPVELPELADNKIVSLGLNTTTTTGKVITVADRVVKFAGCYYDYINFALGGYIAIMKGESKAKPIAFAYRLVSQCASVVGFEL
mmetsp:Transcript_34495/g.40338  ORF Transcript_34495/g.40338 Transcript_34495/m.40338 type:complete len:204 (-) Transcript_34495:172-783(-)|eukprot:CAMPEP_0176436088 /NCGR_PEP_ID=MMETSP0127-20121128/17733_1 /TAXON_ID=938130 /ORGANISM="Platyophrya macrostoma, Strain WH" /LENGTH=203 /DNA_ID=CAMNT_0017819287 /DNA_START=15 /DNA_END=626 /DNA_ORIENTATION=-